MEAGGHEWSEGFRSLEEEYDYRIEDFDGQLPTRLRGTLLRNGSGRNELGCDWFPHWFDGDGLVSALTFADSGVYYRNRFVRTKNYLNETRAGRVLYRGFGKMRPGGVLANAFRLPANVANISVVIQAGKGYALWEGGPPTGIDPADLSTSGIDDFGGRVRAFSAHPRIDPQTGDLYNFGLDYGAKCRLTPYRLDTRGKLTRYASVELPYPVMNHDFVLTSKYLAFCLGPIRLQSMKMLLGLASFDTALVWDPAKPALILLVPRDGAGAPVFIEAEAFFQFHFANGFDQGGSVVMDLVRYPDFLTVGEALRNYHTSNWPARGMGALARLSVDVEGGKSETAFFAAGSAVEFPRINPALTGSRYRYAYVLTNAPEKTEGLQQRVTKVDVGSGRAEHHDFGPHLYPGEPVFIPAAEAVEEDGGYVVTLVLDAPAKRTEVVVLDARDLAAPALYTARLKHRAPFGLHGFYTPRIYRRV
jgi:all-trans-8'-apo-beta-carotenal 15,15'-oxygenase